MKSILFLSRLLINAETRYWPTELKIADLVWVVKKVHHMIKAVKFTTIIYTNHFAAVTITHQTSLNMTFIEKLNLWLIQASEYLQRFCLNIHYKPERTNTISDALFRLASCDYLSETDESSLDALHTAAISTYFNTLIELSSAFCQWILDGYVLKGWWERINTMICRNNALNIDMNAASLPYTMVWGLIYYKNIEWGYWLCISAILYKKVFKLAHNFMRHSGYAHTHKRLTDSLYLLNLFKHLHEYICHCSQCQLMQTPHHHPYEAMQFILMPSRPFYIITIDFILTLSQSTERFNTIMSVTDKFSKAVTFISEWKIMTAEDWAISLMNQLALLNWGLSRAILFNWDCKFTAALWKGLFKQLNVNLLFSTTYHLQTDSSFKVINQVTEIVLHHWLTILKLIQNWPTVLPQLQAALNNSTKYSSILLMSNQVLFSFCTREPLNFLWVEESDVVETSFDKHKNMIDPVDSLANHINSKVVFNENVNVATQQPKRVKLTATYQYRPAHIDAKNAIAFVSMQMKHYYDKAHTSRYFQMNNMVNLHLHWGYFLSSIENKKLNQQFVDPLCITEWISRLAYRLNIPASWKIHDIVFITHLEPVTSAEEDSYCCSQFDHSDTVIMSLNTEPEWEIKRFIQWHTHWKGWGFTTEYLVWWLGYGPEFNSWINIKNLDKARELMNKFDEANAWDQKGVLLWGYSQQDTGLLCCWQIAMTILV